MTRLTQIELFAGIRGFGLAGEQNGIKTILASEIDEFANKVGLAHYPDVPIIPDVRDVRGDQVEPADIITFGSPCQDLSVAGKRTGLDGERSSLLYEAIRIIREMREATNGQYPRFAIWENVPGALSTNKGEDFRAVLESLARIVEPDIVIPRPPRGKWTRAGLVRGEGWSIAWRILDAQYFGVPQRRRRIVLIADFGSERIGEVLFERKGVSGGSAAGREAGSADSRAVEEGSRINCAPDGISGAVSAKWSKGTGGPAGDEHYNLVVEPIPLGYRIRRFTPRECERLQGFPDDWTAMGSDTARYKTLGNSIAVPVFSWLFRRLIAYVDK